MQKFKSVENLINQLKPEKPVYCIRKNSVTIASKFFQKNFPGDILYAVKTNPHPIVIKTLLESGINQFDVASIEEIKRVREFTSTAKCSFMHTIKSPESIKKAYFDFGIKIFSLFIIPIWSFFFKFQYKLFTLLLFIILITVLLWKGFIRVFKTFFLLNFFGGINNAKI